MAPLNRKPTPYHQDHYGPSPGGPSTPVPSSESSIRDPRIHRQTGIPSVSRPRGSISYGLNPVQVPSPMQLQTPTPLPTAQHASKKGTYALLSLAPPHEPAERRSVSNPDFPPPHPSPHPQSRFYENLREYSNSPPLIDFTKFEDTYCPPKERRFEGLLTVSGSGPRLGDSLRARGEVRSVSGGAMGKEGPREARRHRLKSALKRTAPREEFSFGVPMGRGGVTVGVSEPPQPASARKPDPRLILDTLEDLCSTQEEGSADRVLNNLDAYELLVAHQLDQMDSEERERIRGARLVAVLGEPIRRASLYASTQMVLAGREHELPIIVVQCVEELYRTGIYQANLFRTLPNRARLLELIKIFDSEVQPPGSIIRSRSRGSRSNISMGSSGSRGGHTMGFGSATSLHLESTPDICALLATYLSSLPEPVLSSSLFEAIWDGCAIGKEDKEGDSGRGSGASTPLGGGSSNFPSSLSTPAYTYSLHSHAPTQTYSYPRVHHHPNQPPLSRVRTYNSPADNAHILTAQLLLHLLPSPHFSLLVYLLAFFSQVVLVREENGVGVDDVGRMFGARVFGTGGPRHSGAAVSKGKAKEGSAGEGGNGGRQRGEAMMVWFLHRWGIISETLFEVVEDAKMRRSRVMRRDSLGGYAVRGFSREREQEEEGEDEGRNEASEEDASAGGNVDGPSQEYQHAEAFGVDGPALQSMTSRSHSPLSQLDEEIARLPLLNPPILHKSASDLSRYSFQTPVPRIRLQDVDLEPLTHSTPRVKGHAREGVVDRECSLRQRSMGGFENLTEEEGFVLTPKVSPLSFSHTASSARHGDVNPALHERLRNIRERDHKASDMKAGERSASGPDDSLTLPRIERSTSHDPASVYSMPSLTERLMDVSMSTLMDLTMPTFFISDEPEQDNANMEPLSIPPALKRRHSSAPALNRAPATPVPSTSTSKLGPKNEQAERVSGLTKALATVESKLAKERAKVGRLEERLSELEDEVAMALSGSRAQVGDEDESRQVGSGVGEREG